MPGRPKAASPRRTPAPATTPAPAAPAPPPFELPTYRLAAPLDSPEAVETEWLLTDGRGGFAMGTAAGVPTHRYHGLLIAATRPPVGRVLLVNATVDRLIAGPGGPDEAATELSAFCFAGDRARLHPDGAGRLRGFSKSLRVEWTFDTPHARVTRSLHLHRDAERPGVTLRYTVERLNPREGAPPPALRLTVRPLLSLRDFHGLIRRAWADGFTVAAEPRACRVQRDGLGVRLRAEAAGFRRDEQWWYDFFYQREAERQQDCVEDLFSPGEFALDIPPGQARTETVLTFSLDLGPAPGPEPDPDADQRTRRERLVRSLVHARAATPALPADLAPALAALVGAADDFVVARSSADGAPPGVSVIAGYPWFSDWGRDTFISLPGLMLATGRSADARDTLLAFAARRRSGLVPNVFNDQTGHAEYNTADASFWFIHGACAYLEATGDRKAWREHLAPACFDTVAHVRRGTEFNIAMDPFDRLVTAGTSATQLTWMDARRDGVVFTPRHGKAVEINALWVSALARLADAIAPDDAAQAANLRDLSQSAARSFRAAFWNPQAGCLYDVLTPSESERGPVSWIPDPTIRPNQLLAVSLPHSPLSPEMQRSVLGCISERLLTPRGLRTLDPADPRYRPRYEGDMFSRDGAYHQGTVWPWLLGPYAEAVARVGGFSSEARADALAALRPLLDRLTPAGVVAGVRGVGALGQVAEIFDGDEPRRIQGCPAQAWSVAELLRVLVLLGA